MDTAAVGAWWLMMYRCVSGCYHAKKWCWQLAAGYNDLYDIAFDIGTDMDKRKFPFKCDNKDYTIWLWKGDYVNLGAGMEFGIYRGNILGHRYVDLTLNLSVSMKLYYKDVMIMSYVLTNWWVTGFNPLYKNLKAKDLKATYVINFKHRTKLFKAFKKHCNDKLKSNDRKYYANWNFIDERNIATYWF